jgi:hypothetical protein
MKLNIINLLFIILLCVLISCIACKEKHYSITIVNNSNERIVCQYNKKQNFYLFDDTLFDCTFPVRGILPHNQWEIISPRGCDWIKF